MAVGISSLVLIFPVAALDKYLAKKLGLSPMPFFFGTFILFWFYMVIDGLRTGVMTSVRGGDTYRADTPKLFYFSLTMNVLIGILFFIGFIIMITEKR